MAFTKLSVRVPTGIVHFAIIVSQSTNSDGTQYQYQWRAIIQDSDGSTRAVDGQLDKVLTSTQATALTKLLTDLVAKAEAEMLDKASQ